MRQETELLVKINKGIELTLKASGSGISPDVSYTACLFKSADDSSHRAVSVATAETVSSINVVTFVFAAGDDTTNPSATTAEKESRTSNLDEGPCILEIYDTVNRTQMKYVEPFAIVRPTSICK